MGSATPGPAFSRSVETSGLWWNEEGRAGGRRARTQEVAQEVSLGFTSISASPPPPCLLLSVLEPQSPPGLKSAKAYFGSIAGKIFPPGKAALGLWEVPDIKNLERTHTASCWEYW